MQHINQWMVFAFMKVFITGATGLVGAHTALALLHANYSVRLLVRNKAAAKAYYLTHGFDLDDFVEADMLDREAVQEGMKGCDAVIHSAAIVDLDARHAQKTQQTNLQGIESVIGSACELGIEKIIYVSSMSIYYDFTQPLLHEQSPLADVQDAYSYSKKLCELRIRELQSQGHPIISTYPSAVFGPDDPKLAESNSALVEFYHSIMPITSSGMQFIDARDLGIAHRLLLEADMAADKTEERYILGGIFTSWKDLADMLDKAMPKKLLRVPIPGALFRGLGVLFDLARKLFPIAYPISKECTRIVTQLPPASSDKLFAKTGMSFRASQVTLNDTVEWLRKAGHIG